MDEIVLYIPLKDHFPQTFLTGAGKFEIAD